MKARHKKLRVIQSLLLCSIREWNVEKLLGTAQKVLPHPCFVYCTQYHPAAQQLVVTGGYDCLLRVWDLDVDDVNGQLLQEFEGHSSFINTVCFDSEGTDPGTRVSTLPQTGSVPMLCSGRSNVLPDKG